MKCMCSQPCELWQKLQETEDKYCFIDNNCLLVKTGDSSYECFSEQKLQCSICCIESVKAAVQRGEATLTPRQANELEQKLIKILHYYELAVWQRTHRESSL